MSVVLLVSFILLFIVTAVTSVQDKPASGTLLSYFDNVIFALSSLFLIGILIVLLIGTLMLLKHAPKIITTLITKINDYQKEMEEIKIKEQKEEEELIAKIISGNIPPVTLDFAVKFDPKEVPYISYSANRKALIEYIEEHTEGKSQKTGVFGRAIVGSVLLGPVGMLAGAATAGGKQKSTTTQKKIEVTDVVDVGQLILTNKRLLFIGKGVLSLPYKEIISASFDTSDEEIYLKYAGMLKDEHFDLSLSGPSSKYAKYYFEGITKHLLL